MKGQMQDWPLWVPSILDHARLHHPEREVVTRTIEGPIVRSRYAELHARAKRCAKALVRLGICPGDVVATLAMNTGRHLETWYGIIGAGAVCHTLNPRLFLDQIAYIAAHAGDKVLFVDRIFVGIAEALVTRCPDLRQVVVLTDRAHMPETKIPGVVCYEELLAAEDDAFEWVRVDEAAACGMCYTSGTTGNPKGVVYSHRSNVLHALTVSLADGFGLGAADSVLPIVPMFHANAWALSFAAPMVGAKLVMPGDKLDGASVHELIEREGVTFSAGVPTVWFGLLQYLEGEKKQVPSLKRITIGGAAAPRTIVERFERDLGVEVIHGWGMTEMSPLGTFSRLKPGMEKLAWDDRIAVKLKQGRVPFMVEMKIIDDDGKELPHDGKQFGHLVVRGAAIVESYFKGEGGRILDADGWFDTGDVATIDPHGFMQITDRAKDVIKSGGEWISSIELENLAVGHPEVVEAAVIGVPHPKWDERPLLVVVRRKGGEVTREALLDWMQGKIAKWWMPDDVVFVDEIPHTATGKIQKRTLRERFAGHVLPTAK